MSEAMHDVRPEQYPTVIREMIRHENDVTNHRIMWLLIGQGFLANGYVFGKDASAAAHLMLGLMGLLLSLSAFVMLYQSYLARGYLQFLGQKAKLGTLQEEHLPLMGWPRNRIKGWWRSVGVYPWIRKTHDLLEPWLLLPYLFTSLWMIALLHLRSSLNKGVVVILGVLLSTVILSMSCFVEVWSQGKDDEE
jgi:hypothetical protein